MGFRLYLHRRMRCVAPFLIASSLATASPVSIETQREAFRAALKASAQPASDEVREPPRPAKAGEIRDDEYEDLPVEARKRVVAAQKLYKQARELMEAVVPNHPDWSAKQREAAELLKNARDELYQALAEAPGSRALLDLMQQVKADLYACNKHRLK